MSEQSNAPVTPTPTTNAPRKPRVMSHDAAIVAYAKHRKVDTVRAGKDFRRTLRANKDILAKHKSPSAKHQKNAPWPDHSRSALREMFPNVTAFKG